ncbi:hypothetical protein DsansV1_C08g0079981 [Dioscorea sansibarensis]
MLSPKSWSIARVSSGTTLCFTVAEEFLDLQSFSTLHLGVNFCRFHQCQGIKGMNHHKGVERLGLLRTHSHL